MVSTGGYCKITAEKAAQTAETWERRAEGRLVLHLYGIWEELLKGEKLLKDMDDLKAQSESCCRCCGTKRVQP